MKAIVIEKTGGPEVLQYTTDAPTPSPKDNEVLIKNHVAGINYIDTYFRSGLYPSASGYPLILGQEASGVVSALGPGADKHGLKVGDRVVWIKIGGYAEYTTCPADKVAKIPDGVSDEDAVGGFLMGMTALSLVQESYPVQKGDWVLVHAAAGGVGLLMCQILRSMGARMIGTAGGPEKCKLAKENGAEFVIDYKKTDGPSWVEQVKEITGGRGVDVVYDSVGKDTWEGSLQAIKRKGKVCVSFSFVAPSYFYLPTPPRLTLHPNSQVVYFGSSSGAVPPFPIQKLAANNASIMRSTLMNNIVTREEFEHYTGDLFRIMQAGDLKIRIHKIYDLKDVKTAHEDLEGRRTTGKLLLKI